jgi:hypothetical protein
MKFAIALFAVLALFSGACGTGRGPVKVSSLDVGRQRFQTAIAVPDRAYQVYWLGKEFSAAGLVFQGPLVGGFDNPRPDEILTEYVSTKPGAFLTFSVMSSAHWEAARDRVLGPLPTGGSRRSVTVLARDATLLSVSAGDRPIGNLTLIIPFGDAVVYASVASAGAATPGGPDVNPLIDEATFIAVMQNLRPYPQ